MALTVCGDVKFSKLGEVKAACIPLRFESKMKALHATFANLLKVSQFANTYQTALP